MKNFRFLSLCLLILLMSACSSSKNGISSASKEDLSTPISLEDRLRQTSGVFFQGTQVRIRGGDQSFFSDSEPIFVINGQVITGGFAAVNSIVNAAEIRSVRALKDPAELSLYGVRGSNGVIIIRLKNGKGEG